LGIKTVFFFFLHVNQPSYNTIQEEIREEKRDKRREEKRREEKRREAGSLGTESERSGVGDDGCKDCHVARGPLTCWDAG